MFEKTCSKCMTTYEAKNADDLLVYFYRDRTKSPDGLRAVCKDCRKAIDGARLKKYGNHIGKRYYAKNADKVKARDAARRKWSKALSGSECSVLNCLNISEAFSFDWEARAKKVLERGE